MELAKGRSWAEIEADAARASPRAPTRSMRRSRWPTGYGVEMPIAQEVHNALFEGKSVQRCLVDLLARESKDELADASRLAREPRRHAGAGRGDRAVRGPSGARLRGLSGRGAVW